MYILGNINPNNNDKILEYIIAFLDQMMDVYLLLDSSPSNTATIDDIDNDEEYSAGGANSTRTVFYSIKEEAEDFLTTIFQYQTKFLVCHLDGKGDKQSTRQMILHNLLRNMRKKTIDFIAVIITNVLEGKQRLVDRSLEDSMVLYTYHSRDHVPLMSSGSTLPTEYKPNKFHTHAFGQGFSSYPLLHVRVNTKLGSSLDRNICFPPKIPFMRIDVENVTDDNGQLQCIGKWFENVDFIQHLFAQIQTEIKVLDGILTDIRSQVESHLTPGTETIEITDENGNVKTVPDPLKAFCKKNVFMKKVNESTYEFNMEHFFMEWREEFKILDKSLDEYTTQPSLSQKMELVDFWFQQCLNWYIFDTQGDITKPTLLRYQIQSALTAIDTAVRTSSLNLAILGCLNHCEFLVCDPLKSPSTNKLHTSGKKMSEYIGSFHMALVAQAGIAYFDKCRIRKFRATNGVRIKKEKDNNMTQVPSGDEDMEDDKLSTQLSTQLLNLVRTNEIPKVEVLQKLLKSAFSKLSVLEWSFLQSILQCLWTLQGWTRPLDYQEEKISQHAEDTLRMKCVDLTGDDEDDESNVKNKMANFKFAKFTKATKKTNAKANQAMTAVSTEMGVSTPTSGEKTVIANTPRPSIPTSSTPSSITKTAMVPSDTSSSSISLMVQKTSSSDSTSKHLLSSFPKYFHFLLQTTLTT